MYSKQFNRKLKKILHKFSSILLRIHKDLVNYYKRLFRKSSTRQYKLNIFWYRPPLYIVQVLLPTCMYVMFLYCICGNRFLSSFTVLSKNGLPKIVILISRNFCHIKNSFLSEFFYIPISRKIFLNNCIFVSALCEAYYTLNHLSPLSSWMSAKERPRTSTCYT